MTKQRKPTLQVQIDVLEADIARLHSRIDTVSNLAFDQLRMDTKLSDRLDRLRGDVTALQDRPKRIGKLLLYGTVIGLAAHNIVYFTITYFWG